MNNEIFRNWAWIILMCFMAVLNFAFLLYSPIEWISFLYLFNVGFCSFAASLWIKLEVIRQQKMQRIRDKVL